MNTSFQLTNLQYTRIDLPLVKPFTTATTTVQHRTVLAITAHIQINNALGHTQTFTGYGEAAPLPGWSQETIDDCITTLTNLPLNQNFNSILELDAIYPELHHTPTLRAGVELAMLDAIANAHDTSIASVIAQFYNPTAQYLPHTIAVQCTLGAENTADSITQTICAFLAGFSHAKLKIGTASPQEDLQRIADVHAACPEIILRLDANGAWSHEAATQFLQDLQDQPASLRAAIDLIEQPVAPADFKDFIQHIQDLNFPEITSTIAPDESCTTPAATRELIESGPIHAVVLKPATLGGLLPTAQLIAHAIQHNVRVILSNFIESTIGRYATAQLAAAFPQCPGPHGLATGSLFTHDITLQPETIESGHFKLPSHASHHKHDFTHKSPWLAQTAHTKPDVVALVAGDQTLTYTQLASQAQHRAAILRKAGIQPRARIGLHTAPGAENTPEWIFIAHAIFWLGATLVPLHSRATASELAYQLSAIQLDLLILDPDSTLNTTDNAHTNLPRTILTTDLAPQANTPFNTCTPAAINPTDILTILFTSGTTGTPRPVPMTVQNHFASAAASAERLQSHAHDRWLCCLPLCHIGGLAILLRSVIYGTTVELVTHFEPEPILHIIQTRPITLASFVPTMLFRLLDHIDQPITSHLRAILIGGGPIDADMLRKARKLGLPTLPTYGMTEAGSQIATLSPTLSTTPDRLDSAGQPLAGVQIRIENPDGTLCPPGQIGAIRVRGPMLTSGYLPTPNTTNNEQFSNGWFTTGDMGRLDTDGFLYIEHRHGDLIVSGGENVDPREVERIIRQLDFVKDIAVVGIDNPEWGQSVAVALVCNERPDTPDETQKLIQQLTQHCRDRLAPFKIPRNWQFVTEIPRTASGKILRQQTRSLFL